MLLQTNSYIVPQDKRAEHARLLRRFRQVLTRLGCDNFEVYEQVGSNWNTAEISGRVVQIMRFRDRRHQLAVQAAERNDPVAQAVIAEFCNLINFPYQQQQGLFAVGFYNAVLPAPAARGHAERDAQEARGAKVSTGAAAGVASVAASPDEASDPASASTVLDEQSEIAAPGADRSREEALSGEEVPAPPLRAEEALFAEGTEGIIAAAEQLSDEQLDAGGDAAVDSAIAGASADGGVGAAPVAHASGNAEPSSNGTEEHADHPEAFIRPEEPSRAEPEHTQAAYPETLQADQSQADPSQAEQPQGPDGGIAHQAAGDDLDLSSLLDPYLEQGNGHPDSGGNGGAHDPWRDSLSLDDDRAHDEPVPLKDAALGGGPEHDRNHVSQ